MRIRTGAYETKRKEAQFVGPHAIVWATHPDMPNKDGRARGRCLHLERDEEDVKFAYPATFCGMRVVEYADHWCAGNRRICIQCVKIRDQEQAISTIHIVRSPHATDRP